MAELYNSIELYNHVQYLPLLDHVGLFSLLVDSFCFSKAKGSYVLVYNPNLGKGLVGTSAVECPPARGSQGPISQG